MGIAKLKDKKAWKKLASDCVVYSAMILCCPCVVVIWFNFRKRGRCVRRVPFIVDELKSPLPRKRALTIPSDGTLGKHDCNTERQQQCLLFEMLPREIRDNIYYGVLGGDTLHIQRLHGEGIRVWRDVDEQVSEEKVVISEKRVSLLLTCRRM